MTVARAFRRKLELQRAEGGVLGIVRGTLATDGEASDGHVLGIPGGEVSPGIPLLFGHDAFSGDRHLGNWTSFRKIRGTTPGSSRIDGVAEIELEGSGDARDWREDIATMVSKGRIRGFSIRWEPTVAPVPRVNLSKDHPAFVDAETERGPRRWGLYFPKWRALEGSLVSIGSDREAFVESARNAATDSPRQNFYRAAVLDHDQHEHDAEREVEERCSSLELYLGPAKVAGVRETRKRKAPEAIDALLSRLWLKSAQARLGPAFLEEATARADALAYRMTGRTKR